MKRTAAFGVMLLAAGLLCILLVGCDTDRGARKDLPDQQQVLEDSTAQVFLMPDKFPNITHKCEGSTGMWTTTDRSVWIVYQDTMCDGDGTGQVLDNIPGAVTKVVQE